MWTFLPKLCPGPWFRTATIKTLPEPLHLPKHTHTHTLHTLHTLMLNTASVSFLPKVVLAQKPAKPDLDYITFAYCNMLRCVCQTWKDRVLAFQYFYYRFPIYGGGSRKGWRKCGIMFVWCALSCISKNVSATLP